MKLVRVIWFHQHKKIIYISGNHCLRELESVRDFINSLEYLEWYAIYFWFSFRDPDPSSNNNFFLKAIILDQNHKKQATFLFLTHLAVSISYFQVCFRASLVAA